MSDQEEIKVSFRQKDRTEEGAAGLGSSVKSSGIKPAIAPLKPLEPLKPLSASIPPIMPLRPLEPLKPLAPSKNHLSLKPVAKPAAEPLPPPSTGIPKGAPPFNSASLLAVKPEQNAAKREMIDRIQKTAPAGGSGRFSEFRHWFLPAISVVVLLVMCVAAYVVTDLLYGNSSLGGGSSDLDAMLNQANQQNNPEGSFKAKLEQKVVPPEVKQHIAQVEEGVNELEKVPETTPVPEAGITGQEEEPAAQKTTEPIPYVTDKSDDKENFASFLATEPDEGALRLRLATAFRQDNLELHKKLLTDLYRANLGEFARREYMAWVEENPRSYAANMIAGIYLSRSSFEKIKYLDHAARLGAAREEEPYRRLIALYESTRDWRKVASTANQMLLSLPDNAWALNKAGEARIRSGANPETELDTLTRYYVSRGMKPAEIAQRVLPLVQMFSLNTRANTLLEKLKAPEFQDQYKRFMITQALIENKTVEPSMLQEYLSEETRQAQLLYLVSHNDLTGIQRVVTPAGRPDFWKVFMGWSTSRKDYQWDLDVQQLVNQHRADPGGTVATIGEMWNGRLKAETVRRAVDRYPAADAPLFYLTLAIDAARQRRLPSAKVLIEKALESNPGCYTTLIQYYKNKIRAE